AAANRAVGQYQRRDPYGQQTATDRPEHSQIQLGITPIELPVRRPEVGQVVGRDGRDEEVVQSTGDDQHTSRVQQDQPKAPATHSAFSPLRVERKLIARFAAYALLSPLAVFEQLP